MMSTWSVWIWMLAAWMKFRLQPVPPNPWNRRLVHVLIALHDCLYWLVDGQWPWVACGTSRISHFWNWDWNWCWMRWSFIMGSLESWRFGILKLSKCLHHLLIYLFFLEPSRLASDLTLCFFWMCLASLDSRFHQKRTRSRSDIVVFSLICWLASDWFIYSILWALSHVLKITPY